MAFGFFKKKKAEKDAPASSRRRRMIQSQRTPAAKPGTGSTARASAVSPGSGAVPAAAPRADVGQLKRGDSAALQASIDTTAADSALRDFIIENELGEPGKINDAYTRKSDDTPFVQILVEEQIVNENEILVELSKKCMIPQGKLAKYRIRKKALECLSPELSRKLCILPVDKLGQILSVAMVNPLNKEAIKSIGSMTGLRIKTVVCTYSEFMEQYTKHYTDGGEVSGSEESLDISIEEPEAISPEDFKKSLQAAAPAPAAAEPAPAAAEPEPITAEEAILDLGAVEAEEIIVPEPVEAEPVFEEISGEPVAPAAAAPVEVEEIVPQDTTNVLNIEMVEEEELVIEPVIEGISLAAEDDEEELVIEPIIIPTDNLEPVIEAGTDFETVEALSVVEEEFRQGITLGSIDLFKKWENLHRKNRIITLNPIPVEVFDFMEFAG